MIRFPNTLTFRLTRWYCSAFAIFLVAAFLFLYLSMNSIMDSRLDEDLEENIEEFQILLKTEGLTVVEQEISRESLTSEESKDEFIRLFNNQGELIYSSNLSYWQGLEIDNTAFSEAASNEPVIGTLSLASRDYDTRTIYGRIGPDIILNVGETLEEKAELMEILLAVFTVIFVLVIPLSSFVGWFMAKHAVKGIEEVSRIAANTQSGQLDGRVNLQAPDEEVQKLADTFNAMLDRIRDLISGMRELTDNIAHDLRSPLARIRAIAEQSLSSTNTKDELQSASADTIEECDRLLTMINTTLDVAEVEVGTGNQVKEEVNVTALTEDACELFGPVAEQKDIDLSCALSENCRIVGNNQNLQRMLANLLDNALKYTFPKGQVKVDLENTGEAIIISVADTGVGIPETERSRIFERFYRCDQSRSRDGCGLGLSYTQAVARAHGGNTEVRSELGNGSTFTVTLPLTM